MSKWIPAIILFGCWICLLISGSQNTIKGIAIIMQAMFVIYWGLYIDEKNKTKQ